MSTEQKKHLGWIRRYEEIGDAADIPPPMVDFPVLRRKMRRLVITQLPTKTGY